MKGIIINSYLMKPKKPNSALRKIVLVQKNKHIYKVFVPGENATLIKHSEILFIYKPKKDCPGIKYRLIRGAKDIKGVVNRKRSRSKYGTKKN